MSYLLLFTIGPVQSLIENSRKAGDLYAGSKLLSRLMRDTVHSLEKTPGVKILFPIEQKSGTDEESDMPNRLIAEFQTGDSSAPEDTARRLEDHVRKRFLEICRGLLREAGIGESGLRRAERQLREYLEVYWLLEPYDGVAYADVYQKMFKEIFEVKGIRPFNQITEPWSRKCMLFPEYNAIFAKKVLIQGEKTWPANVNPEDVWDITELDLLRYAVKQKEALSAIALVKRIYGKKLGIYSLRQMLLRSRAGDLVTQKAERGDLLANAVYDMDNGNGPDYEEYDQEAWEEGGRLRKELKDQKITLSSYYALVKFDGDSMGDEFLNRTTPEAQGELSREIGRFAQNTPEIIQRHKGLPVYAGGEDFLGFLPVDTLFDCLAELHREFLDTVKLTFSAGIVVAHLMQPMKEVMAAADDMEGRAKRAEGKNAFVIGLLKRGGEKVITMPYRFDEGPSVRRPSCRDMKELVDELNASGCSKTLLYHIGDLFRGFLEDGVRPPASMAEILIREAALSSDAKEPWRLARRLMTFYETEEGLAGFLNTLNAVSFLAREVVGCTMR